MRVHYPCDLSGTHTRAPGGAPLPVAHVLARARPHPELFPRVPVGAEGPGSAVPQICLTVLLRVDLEVVS